MPVNWDDFDQQIDEAITQAGQQTDDQLAGKISSVTTMTDEEVKALFPDPADVKKLTDLMKVLQSSADRNTKINQIMDNTQEFGSIVLTLLSKFT